MNHYDLKTRRWTQRHAPLIDGEGKQNAYWQVGLEPNEAIHLSWVWRTHGGVESNHDVGYAKSTDAGLSWRQSNGQACRLPITADSADYAVRIPEGHELINTTSMAADSRGRPYIATYWRAPGTAVPQYRLIHHDGSRWCVSQIGQRRLPFSLAGGGSKRLIMSRPRIAIDTGRGADKAYVFFRDTERGDRVSVAICEDLSKLQWRIEDLTDHSVGVWEPSYDTELWKRSRVFHLYLQKVGQGDGETLEDLPPTPVSILEWKPPTAEGG